MRGSHQLQSCTSGADRHDGAETSPDRRRGEDRAARPDRVGLRRMSRMERSNTQVADHDAILDCARWLEECLDALPDRDPGRGWKDAVLRSQQRRDAEFAIAAALQRRGGSRTTVTTSTDLGTTIRMLGVRSSSTDGFEAACRHWIEKARRQGHAGRSHTNGDGAT